MKYKGNKNKKEKIHENSCHKLLKKYVRSFLRTRPCIGAKGSYKYIKEIIYLDLDHVSVCLHCIIFKKLWIAK
jgi:hypothetical protein